MKAPPVMFLLLGFRLELRLLGDFSGLFSRTGLTAVW